MWVGFHPFALKSDESTGKRTGIDFAATRKILGVGPEAPNPSIIDEIGSLATAEGKAWGLPATAIAEMPVEAADVGTLLAAAPNGQATAWTKSFGKGLFVRLWGRQRPIGDSGLVRRIAERCVSDR